MAKLQKTFKESYVKTLRDDVLAGIGLERYALEEFPYDKTMVKSLANVYQPENLQREMDPNDDFKSAVVLYEAYKDISPLLASNEIFWIYLTHVDLFNYVQNRWPLVFKSNVSSEYIKNHFFYSDNGMIRTSLMGFWWSVYCSIDESSCLSDKYDLTRILFRSTELRTRRWGNSVLFRHREATVALLWFIKENISLFESGFSEKCRYITRYFNRLGATKVLAYLNRDFFKAELNKMRVILEKINESSGISD